MKILLNYYKLMITYQKVKGIHHKHKKFTNLLSVFSSNNNNTLNVISGPYSNLTEAEELFPKDPWFKCSKSKSAIVYAHCNIPKETKLMNHSWGQKKIVQITLDFHSNHKRIRSLQVETYTLALLVPPILLSMKVKPLCNH